MKIQFLALITLLLVNAFCVAQKSEAQTGDRRALIVCGLSGSEEFQEQFSDSVTKIRTALTERFGFDKSNVRIQFGRSDEQDPFKGLPTAGRATREEIADEAKRLVRASTQDDTAWIFVIGHSYCDGRTAFLNIPDVDISHRQFSKMFDKLVGKSTFFICTPVSGFYIKELSKPNRIVMTSTEADYETNASIYHTALAKSLTEIKPGLDSDLDKNGTVSLLDLYIKSTQHLSDLYVKNDPPLIATEHPNLDDNGDGRGSELQVDYLTVAQGGRSDSKRMRRFRKFKDGAIAASIALTFDERKSAESQSN